LATADWLKDGQMKKDNFINNHFLFGAAMMALALNLGCEHGARIVDNAQPIPSQMPQADIPWPSLANSPWPMYLHDPQHTGRSPYRGPQEGKVEWRFQTGNSVYSSPTISPDGTVYFGSHDGFFYAVNPDGTLKWKFQTEVRFIESTALISSDGTIYFPASDGVTSKFYALHPNGALRWRAETSGGEWTLVISKDGETIYAGGPRSAFALRARDGSKKWEMANRMRYAPGLSPSAQTIYWGSYDGHLYAVDTTGAVKWIYALGGSPSSPSIDNDGNVYINGGGYCYAIAENGTLRWKFYTAGHLGWSSPSIGNDATIYTVGLGGTRLYALDYAGRCKWEFDLHSVGGSLYEKHSENTPIIDSDGTIYLGTLTKRTTSDSINFFALHSDGALKYALSLRSPSEPGIPENLRVPDIDSTPAISVDGRIYVGSDRPRGFHVYKIK
jgi:outer membrane protein assembly factor BamB